MSSYDGLALDAPRIRRRATASSRLLSAVRTAARTLAEQLDGASWQGVHLDGAHRGGVDL